MSKLDQEFADLIAAAAQDEDQTVAKSGGDFEPPAAGKTVGRLIEYIELGMQPQKAFKGKAKADAPMVRVTFELLGPKNIKEIEVNGEKKKIADRISLTMVKGLNEKNSFFLLMKTLRYDRPNIKHMSQMLGEAFVIDVFHSEPTADGKVYANIKKDGAFTIYPPFKEDAITGQKEMYKIPEHMSQLRLFLFDRPTEQMWSRLFIEGENIIKDENGKEVRKSKNWIQEKIKAATNYRGSALESMLLQALPSDKELKEAQAVAKADTKKKATKKVEEPSDDPLAELGLV